MLPQFEMMTGDLLARTVQPVQNALRDAGISASQLGKVLLVGGSTRMPAVERQVRELLGCEPSHTLNPDECVAMGAAVQGGLLQGGGKLATYHCKDESPVSDNKNKIMILGGGPNRIGQGIEFDYCCVHAAMALKKAGFETIIVNCNPETVSTDYDTSDKLYFEPLTLEDVLSIYKKEQPLGVIAQFGAQTPLNLSADLEKYGVKILGTSPEVIDMAEDRDLFRAMMDKLFSVFNFLMNKISCYHCPCNSCSDNNHFPIFL